MRCACIDIGSNTTRLLVAEAAHGRLSPVLQQRAFTRIGHRLDAARAIPSPTIAAVAEVVAALRERAGVDVAVLSADDEGRLAFAGATRTLERALDGTVAVVDVGGMSTEIAIGTIAAGVSWLRSFA